MSVTDRNVPAVPARRNPQLERGVGRRWSPKRTIALMVMLIFAVLQLFPLIWLIDFSLLPDGAMFGTHILQWPISPQWQNYIAAFQYGDILRFGLNSIIVSCITVVITVYLSVTMGYAFTRMQWKWKKVVMNTVLLGLMIPLYATLIPNFTIFYHMGIYDSYWALILPNIAFGIPLGMYVMTGFLESLPRSLEEAAIMDGLGVAGLIFRVIIPITMPAISTVGVLTFLGAWNEFIIAQNYVQSNQFKTLPWSVMQFTGEYSSRYGAQLAVMACIAIPTVIVYFIFSKQISRGIMTGTVK